MVSNNDFLKIDDAKIEENFYNIAKKFFEDFVLKVNNNYYQLLDLEFYYYKPNNHEDLYAHKHKFQKSPGQWYFHGSGIDITFGDKTEEVFGGILIRAILPLSDTPLSIGEKKDFLIKSGIHGPLNVKTEISSKLHPVFDTKENVFCMIPKSEIGSAITTIIPIDIIIKTKRIGLNPYKDQSDEKKFYNAKYRFVTFPISKLKDKTQIASDMQTQFPEMKNSEINKKLGSTFLPNDPK